MPNDHPVTVGLVTAFNPPEGLVLNCQALLRECTGVVVVDDGSDITDNSTFEALSALGCSVVRFESNRGIASALNAGVRHAQSLYQRLDFILTMDQDSLVEPGFVHALVEAANDAQSVGLKVGMVAPANVSGLPKRARTLSSGVTLGDEPVQSGLLIPIESLLAIGPFNERLFIDGVDSDFYLRAHEAGRVCVIAKDASLNHSLGQMVPASLGPFAITWQGRPMMVRTATSWRYYYIVRNRIFLFRQYRATQPWWAVRGVLMDLRHLLLVTVLAKGRRKRLAAAVLGARDGLRGRMGPSPLLKSQ
ncbi:glycosyltransferase [Arthrobacter sp. SLBN-112]|uniref:glycosyltransferase n=1 Tax=Arthrobacter sp. SLBN-112 TaxID=2768452 RepID=UPI0027B4EB89|nr:glycosyltransferase [Arthrobacter sp. SLBN-112]MDQ0800631.1 rhamnosyltransferase [Arthrobacter sp. SLBN-112]